jgi:hypothetical protein
VLKLRVPSRARSPGITHPGRYAHAMSAVNTSEDQIAEKTVLLLSILGQFKITVS